MVPHHYRCSYCSYKIQDGNIHDGEVCPSCGSPETLMSVEIETIPNIPDDVTPAPTEEAPIVPETHGAIWEEHEQDPPPEE